jgi:fluoroacetyl-CoA thioesterase
MSDLELKPGVSLVKHYDVEKVSTARHLGSGGVEVLATPELVRMMEETSLAAVASLLPEGSTTVGVTVDVTHLAPTPVGFGVDVEATLIKVDGRMLTFEVVARDDLEEIGRAKHDRAIIDMGRFLNRIQAKLQAKKGTTAA